MTVNKHTKIAGLLCRVGNLCAPYESLRRNATDIDASTTEQLAFDNRGFQTLPTEAAGEWRARLPGPDHNCVEFFAHARSPV